VYSDIALAERLINLGNPRGAIEPLRRAIAAEPDHALAHAYLGVCLLDVGEDKAAAESIRSALAVDPEHWYVLFAAGRIALLQRSYPEAEQHLENARRRAPWYAPVYRHLADLYRQTKRILMARKVLEDGRDECPTDASIISDIGSEILEQGRIEEAETKALEALSLDPESVDAHILAGYVRLRQDRRSEALDHALAALSTNAMHPAALRLLCAIKLRANFLLGLWWRLAVAIGEYPYNAVADFFKLAWTLCVGAITFSFLAGEARVAVILSTVLVLWIAAMLACKALFERGVRRELMALHLRRGF
jgi:tetratricopeptide (TPR) repeat protein